MKALATSERSLARRTWKAGAARLHFGSCDDCHRTSSDDGRPLLVARQERCRLFLCFDCFLARCPASGRLKAAA
jgi:hypothetical protein